MTREIVGITVTYGDRLHLVRQVIQAARDNGVSTMVVVDNGAKNGVAAAISVEFGDYVNVVSHPHNLGSAEGFKSGLQRALDLHAEYLVLLDDDNALQEASIATLKAALADGARLYDLPLAKIAVAGFRPEHHADVAAGLPLSRINPRRGGFFGFHILDIPYKFWRRTGVARAAAAKRQMARLVALDVAPWSGLFFHVDLVKAFGLPRADFVLYADDTEFTWRVTSGGGKILLCTEAGIRDLETSWNYKGRTSNSFDSLIMGTSTMRIYYGTRNRAYFERFCNPASLWRTINRFVFLAMIRLMAIRRRRSAHWELIKRAVADGERGMLGVSPEFPLRQVSDG